MVPAPITAIRLIFFNSILASLLLLIIIKNEFAYHIYNYNLTSKKEKHRKIQIYG